MRIAVLGSAAGGGFPQWNCDCPTCRRARRGDPTARPRTQCSLAVSADGAAWHLLNASPDLRQQVLATPALHPRDGPRHSPIRSVVLTGGEVDAIAGLLGLRESQPFALYATADILAVLGANRIFDALRPEFVARRRLRLGEPTALGGGLVVEAFAVPGKVALYLEAEDDGSVPAAGAETEGTVGLRVASEADDARCFYFVPGCARMSDGLARRLAGAPLVFFDGTLWTDDELIRTGTGTKTGARMGHMPISGPGGSLAAFDRLGVGRRIFVHLNNTNPVLLDDSPERAAVRAAGWEVAHDGMEVTL